jgi:hypothetical protein
MDEDGDEMTDEDATRMAEMGSSPAMTGASRRPLPHRGSAGGLGARVQVSNAGSSC